jgi:5-formyltetrahydrofolate cyclo-ligase
METFGVGIAHTITAINLTSAGGGRAVADTLVAVTDDAVVAAKSALRARLLADRRAVPPQERAAEAAALAGHLEALAGEGDTVCAYVPVGSEPGSPAMLTALIRRGVRVLVPVVRTQDDGTPLALWWGRYRPDSLTSARFGLREPPAPWLPPETLAEAGLIVVPAVAVDRRGMRLGRGAGFYDRSLAFRRPQISLIAVVRDAELLDTVPAQPHDVPMTHALTPGLGLVPLG